MRRVAPVRAWHLALVPAVVAANWLLMTARHEGAHAAVVLAFGGEVADVHLWPPARGTLSWITFRLPLAVPAVAVPLQAAAPAATAVVLLAATVLAARRLPAGLLRANVLVAGAVFPCCELAALVAGYWYGGGDLVYVLGPATAARRWATTAAGALVVAGGLALAVRGLRPAGAAWRQEPWTTSTPRSRP